VYFPTSFRPSLLQLGILAYTSQIRLDPHSNMAARKFSVVNELYDMTECSICTEVFTDPRVLPCIHTFCLNCLMNYGKDQHPGDDMACPLCRKEFTIPDDGFSGIQKNFFMVKLVSARKLSAVEEVVICDVCSSDEDRPSEATSAAKRGYKALLPVPTVLLRSVCTESQKNKSHSQPRYGRDRERATEGRNRVETSYNV